MLDALCIDMSEPPTYNSLINAMVDVLYDDAYLFRHKDKIREFEELLISFIRDTLKVNESDLVSDVEDTVKKTVAYFEQQRPKICNIIILNIEESLKNYKITFEKDFDYLCIVADRDPESFFDWQFDDVLKNCQNKGFKFLLSNPNFEFWLLMHSDEVLSVDKEKIKLNEKINKNSKSSVRFLPNELRKVLGKYKKNSYNADLLVHSIDTAIKNEKVFSEDLTNLKTKIGSNIGLFIEELRKIK